MPGRPTRTLLILLALAALAALAITPRVAAIGETAAGGATWILRAEVFWDALADGRFADTLVAPHPGATLAWISGASLRLTGAESALERLRAASIPLAVLSGLLAVLITALLARLLTVDGHRAPWLKALLVGLFLALEPVSISQSAVVGLDGITPLGVFATFLAGLLYLRSGSRRTLALAGLGAGLCVATKAPGMFLLPLALLAYLPAVPWRRFRPVGDSLTARRVGALALATLAGSIVIPVLLMPAFWVEPLATARTLLAGDLGSGSLSRVVSARSPKVFILGDTTRHPGPFFYPLNLAFRMTPLVLVGLVILLARGRRRAGRLAKECLLFTLFLMIVLGVIEKKSWRYVALVLPAVDTAAALGLVAVAGALANRARPAAIATILVLLVTAQGAWVLSRGPWYGLAFNPLLGGTRIALHAVPISKSEGLKPAVEFLAGEAERLGRPITWSGGYVVRTAAGGFVGVSGSAGQRFAPPTVSFIGRDPEDRRADYHVLCLSYVQRATSRLKASDFWWRVHGRVVHRVTFDGLELVTIYAR